MAPTIPAKWNSRFLNVEYFGWQNQKNKKIFIKGGHGSHFTVTKQLILYAI